MSETYTFGRYTLPELIAIAGQSPAYVYERKSINNNIAKLRKALPDRVLIHYSLKANPLAQLVSHIATQVDGLDVASHSEMVSALGSTAIPANVSFSGPGKSERELTAAMTAGLTIHVESEGELHRLTNVAANTGVTPKLSVRINPDFTVRQSGMVMGGGSQPFGVDQERVGDLLTTMADIGLKCQGLHCYIGSQVLSADIIIDAQARILDMMSDIVSTFMLDTQNLVLNIGGGFGIPYFQGEADLNISAVGDALSTRLDTLRDRLGDMSIAVETGRYIVGNAGIYIARVTDRKESRGKVFLVVDGGLNHHLAATGNLGQVIRRNYPLKAGPVVMLPRSCETVSVVGPLCTPLDILGSDVELERLDVGDFVAVLQSGAYGYSASPHGFLGHPPPAELFI